MDRQVPMILLCVTGVWDMTVHMLLRGCAVPGARSRVSVHSPVILVISPRKGAFVCVLVDGARLIVVMPGCVGIR